MSKVVQQLSEGLAETVQAAGARLVRVEARRRLAATGIVWSTDGLIVTANHIVRRDDKIRVGLPDESTVDAELIWARSDIQIFALLRVNASGLKPMDVADIEKAAVGHLVPGPWSTRPYCPGNIRHY